LRRLGRRLLLAVLYVHLLVPVVPFLALVWSEGYVEDEAVRAWLWTAVLGGWCLGVALYGLSRTWAARRRRRRRLQNDERRGEVPDGRRPAPVDGDGERQDA
jgi:type VI protein secretion system component VasK